MHNITLIYVLTFWEGKKRGKGERKEKGKGREVSIL